MIVSILFKTLLKTQNDLGKLPSVLHLSLDNCWRENKNRFVLSFLSALVQLDILSEINVTFLLVGHTVSFFYWWNNYWLLRFTKPNREYQLMCFKQYCGVGSGFLIFSWMVWLEAEGLSESVSIQQTVQSGLTSDIWFWSFCIWGFLKMKNCKTHYRSER